jgi:DNA-binding NarL/FixJ family response regulator
MSIYVIDDHPLIRDAVSMVLRRVRPAANIVELDCLSRLDAAVSKHGPPELVCLDLNLPDTSGCSGVVAVKRSYSDAPLAVYSSSPAEEMAAQCIASGADVYVAKDTGGKQLAASLRALLDVGSDSVTVKLAAASSSLTRRQLELVNLLNEGATNRELAERLGISEETVKVHMWRLFKRLGVNSRTQALHYARTNDLLAGSGAQQAPWPRTTGPVASIPDLPLPSIPPHPRS